MPTSATKRQPRSSASASPPVSTPLLRPRTRHRHHDPCQLHQHASHGRHDSHGRGRRSEKAPANGYQQPPPAARTARAERSADYEAQGSSTFNKEAAPRPTAEHPRRPYQRPGGHGQDSRGVLGERNLGEVRAPFGSCYPREGSATLREVHPGPPPARASVGGSSHRSYQGHEQLQPRPGRDQLRSIPQYCGAGGTHHLSRASRALHRRLQRARRLQLGQFVPDCEDGDPSGRGHATHLRHQRRQSDCGHAAGPLHHARDDGVAGAGAKGIRERAQLRRPHPPAESPLL